jgi:hypothetical protein
MIRAGIAIYWHAVGTAPGKGTAKLVAGDLRMPPTCGFGVVVVELSGLEPLTPCLQTTIEPSPELAARCLKWLLTGLTFSRRCWAPPGAWLRWLPDWLPVLVFVTSSGQRRLGRRSVRFPDSGGRPLTVTGVCHSYHHVARHTPVTATPADWRCTV